LEASKIIGDGDTPADAVPCVNGEADVTMPFEDRETWIVSADDLLIL